MYDKIIQKGDRKIKIMVNPLTAMFLRNQGQPLVGMVLRLIPACGGKTSPIVVKSLKKILLTLSVIAKPQGIKGLVLYLKQVSVLTQQVICGYKVTTTLPRVKRTKSGIPLIFPANWRLQLVKFNKFYIKFALTITSLYRDLTFKAKPDLSSIIDPGSSDPKLIKQIKDFIPKFVKLFCFGLPDDVRRNMLLGKFLWFPILKSSPQSFGPLTSTNPITMIRSAGALSAQQIKSLYSLMALSAGNGTNLMIFSGLLDLCREVSSRLTTLYTIGEFTGKLGFKQEAAGKVRVFAMVDPWSQLVLAPIHRVLFWFLSKHSRLDGTFNQLAPIERIPRGKPLYSMDLSSATDRLPISIQTPLLRQVFNLSKEEALNWESLLIERAYQVDHRDLNVKSVKYSVGQPMGALSSWAMLAFTHHLIVQFAALQVQGSLKSLFRDYCILGDDIVIFNHKVAKKYHDIISSLGVKCNLNKSILSPRGLGLEFAKQTFLLGTNVSPAPLKELASALISLPTMVDYIIKYKLSLAGALKTCGFGFRVIGSCNKPFHKLNIKVRYLTLVLSISKGGLTLLDSFIHLRRWFTSQEFLKSYQAFLSEYMSSVISKCFKDISDISSRKLDALPQMCKVALIKSDWKYARDIAHKFGFYQTIKFNSNIKHVVDRLTRLQDIIRKRDFDLNNRDSLLKITIDIVRLEQMSSRISIKSIFYREDDLNQSKRPGIAKLFRLHLAYATVVLNLKKSNLITDKKSNG
jgi:hypothetical protein